MLKYVGLALLAALGVILAYVAVLIVSALFVDKNREYGTNSRYYRALLESATAIGFFLLRVKIHAAGLEKLPEGTRFVLASNHRSNYDPLVEWHVLRGRQIAFLSKADNFKVPVFGRLIRRCGFLAIDRSSPRSSMETVCKAAQMIKEDIVSFGLYPEGTRSKECVLLPFHNGIFTLAHKAEVPIVVVALRGTEEIHKRFIRHRTDVYFDLVDVIPAEEHKNMRTNEIGDRVRRGLENILGDGKQ